MRRKIITQVKIFIYLVFSLSILLSLFIGLTGGHHIPYLAWSYVSMLIPSIAVLLLFSMFRVSAPAIPWPSFSGLKKYKFMGCFRLFFHVDCIINRYLKSAPIATDFHCFNSADISDSFFEARL